MAYNEQLAEQVRKALSHYKVEEKRMFGGIGFMVNGNMCVTVNNRPDHVMMVRIDPEVQAEALKKNGAQIAVMRVRKMNGWIFLTNEAIASKGEFDYWVQLALEFNKHIKKSKQ